MLMMLSLFCTLMQDEPVFSGPQPGEKLVPFVATGVLGKDADQKIDVVTESDTKPCVLIFVHERSRPAFGLSNMVMRLVQDRDPEKIAGSLIFLTDDPTETAEWMNRVPDYFPKLIRLGISVDGKEDPGAYGLNRNVSLTVLIAKDNVVSASFALVQPGVEVDGPKIFKAIAEVLGEKDVPKIADYQPKSRGDSAPMKRETDPQHPEIRSMLSPVIQKTATDEEVVVAANAVADCEFRTRLKDLPQAIANERTLSRIMNIRLHDERIGSQFFDGVGINLVALSNKQTTDLIDRL